MSDIRYARTARMLDDPDLGGDLLLVGLAYARFLDFGMHPGKKLTDTLIAACAFPGDRLRRRKLKRLHADDARTYSPPRQPWTGECAAPMIRREGTCGREVSRWRPVTDWRDGEVTWVGGCYRHRDWVDETARANQAEKPRRVPTPAANSGGVLARHLPEFAWPKIWAWATDGRWIEHPESEPWKPPTLTLHLGDGSEDGRATRPLLVPVEAS